MVELWRPPDVESPTAWQMAQAGKYLCANEDSLAFDLSRLTGGEAVVGSITLSRRAEQEEHFQANLAEGLSADCELLSALVAAALGYDAPAEVDLQGCVERAVIEVLGRCVENWRSRIIGPLPGSAEFIVEVSCACLGVHGCLRLPTGWPQLWRSVCRWLDARAPKLGPLLSHISVTVSGLLRGPALRAAEALSMKVGDLIALPAGAERRVALTARGLPVALGSLGVLSEHLAVRVEQVAGGTCRDGE
ncbi:MAG: FliM/FliN family flagellar motor C-terminal domain-containing protein [Armatimonadetes bacterium]|nr:FliM/FliN family flagellar motor C-terminal domain-containing protein [Armatimonadota bacterium]